MLQKKLLTLACVVGILLFGACVFIPPKSTPPVPAPPRVEFQGIQTIEVAVTNVSESKHLDPAELAQAVVKAINDRSESTTMKAEVQKDGALGDAVLKITVQGESAVSPSPGSQSTSAQTGWNFRFTVSSTLTKADGSAVWSEANRPSSVYLRLQTTPESVWNNPELMRSFLTQIGNGLVFRMFYQK